ncbi:MAG: Zn-binding dehydrogenase [Rhodobacteraceae bacterium HLUCCA12]|nr:MAG: Zn-binding dehydrogenase [Rhodobacteraceae bacterium HLUCCA12]
MKAYRIEQDGKLGRGTIVDMDRADLDEGDVTVKVRHAGVNYKDALAGLGGAPIIRRYPCNGGIEAVGDVVESTDVRFSPGDRVIVHGRGIGVSHDGGFAEYLRVPGDWVLALPEGLSALEAATLGVAGYSAALAVDRLETLGLSPERGPVLVSGATGGVGSLGVAMLARRGFSVTALSSKPDDGFLRGLGAQAVMALPEASGKPLEREEWAGGIDAAGGKVLEWMLRTTAHGGAIASIGNAAGVALNTTVLPFILRGITLTGINADSEMPLRRRIWARLADDLKPAGLQAMAREIVLADLPDYMARMLEGRITGRTLVTFDD